MSRKNRVWYPGAIYHVMSRGNRKTVLYKDTSDYLRFLECIVMAKEQFGFKIHSICLMTNHFHMALETQDKELWKIMQKILHPYSMDFNHRYNFTGHLFESRYNAKPMGVRYCEQKVNHLNMHQVYVTFRESHPIAGWLSRAQGPFEKLKN